MLLAEQEAILRLRFPWFDAAACAHYFAAEQPPRGVKVVPEQGEFPAVILANGVTWFPDKEARPLCRANAEGHRPPMKSQVPRGAARNVIYDTLDAPELLLVEGEMHALAARSVGLDGVLVAGGVSTILASTPEIQSHLRRVFEGKSIRLLFDADRAGRGAVDRVAQQLLRVGRASKVAVVDPPYSGRQDLDEWLLTWPDPARALGELTTVLGGATWLTADQLGESTEGVEPTPTQSERVYVDGDPLPTLVVMTYDELTRQPGLAIFTREDLVAPVGGEPLSRAYGSVQHDAPEPAPVGPAEGMARGWALLESWVHGGRAYVPDLTGDMLRTLADRTIVLPPPPFEGHDTSEQLWADARAFMGHWVALPTDYYDVMVAYAFLTWRLEDAGFQHVPYLRFYGPPGKGKGRALEVMRSLCWRSLGAKPSMQNLHRLIDYFRDITLVIDEFHLDRGNRERAQELIDTLNQGHKKSERQIRVDRNGVGVMSVKCFPIFGPKIFAGYGVDEDSALARRTVAVPMGEVPVPQHMKIFDLPQRFYADAQALRGRFLAWRGRKLHLGRPDPEGERARTLCDRAGLEVGQAFWPLVEMVPASMPEVLDRVMAIATKRRDQVASSREVTEEAVMLGMLIDVYAAGEFAIADGHAYVKTLDVYNKCREVFPALAISKVVRKLRDEGVHYTRRRLRDAGTDHTTPFFVLDANDERLQRALARHSIRWPSNITPKEKVL